MPHSVIFRKFPQKCAPSVDRFKPIRERLQKIKKVKANAQGYSHLPTHLMVPTYRSNTNLFKKISLGTKKFIFCQIWLIENSTMSSKQILIGQLWTREGANIQKITQCNTKLSDWLSELFQPIRLWLSELPYRAKWVVPSERALKTKSETGVKSFTPFCWGSSLWKTNSE